MTRSAPARHAGEKLVELRARHRPDRVHRLRAGKAKRPVRGEPVDEHGEVPPAVRVQTRQQLGELRLRARRSGDDGDERRGALQPEDDVGRDQTAEPAKV